jgi:urease beta subunit
MLLPFVSVQNNLSFSDEVHFHLHVALTNRILEFGRQRVQGILLQDQVLIVTK